MQEFEARELLMPVDILAGIQYLILLCKLGIKMYNGISAGKGSLLCFTTVSYSPVSLLYHCMYDALFDVIVTACMVV